MNPCEQTEKIKEMHSRLNDGDKTLHELKVRQVEIGADVAHIKGRIDNGMSQTIKSIDTKLTTLLPVIEHHSKIVTHIESIGWLLSKGIILALVGMLIWAIGKGYLPKI